MKLQSKVAIVTGASRGIGKAIAIGFAQEGAWVKEEERKEWVSPEKMIKCAIFMAQQDAGGVTGKVATDEEICAWHGL